MDQTGLCHSLSELEMHGESALSYCSRGYKESKQKAQSRVRSDGHRYAAQRSFTDQSSIKVLVACVHCPSAQRQCL